MRQLERLLAVGLLIAAAVVMMTYYLGFVAISVAFPVASVLAITGGVGMLQWIEAQVEAEFNLRAAPLPSDVSTAQGSTRK